jgi:hypothetical protein
MFKRILIGGWALLLLNAVLVVMFPNAAWNSAASWTLWVFSIALFVSTFAFCVVVTIRLASRLVRRVTRSQVGEIPRVAASSEKQQPRRLVLNLMAVLGIGAFVAGLLVFIEHGIKTSPVYQASAAKARTSSEVTKIIGQPVHEGWFCSGLLTQSSNGSGHARLKIPLSGPNGKGTLEVEAARLGGNWRFSTLQFSTAGHAPTVELCCDERRN